MEIRDVSFTVNACILPFAPYTPNDEAEHKMEKFLQEFKGSNKENINLRWRNFFKNLRITQIVC